MLEVYKIISSTENVLNFFSHNMLFMHSLLQEKDPSRQLLNMKLWHSSKIIYNVINKHFYKSL